VDKFNRSAVIRLNVRSYDGKPIELKLNPQTRYQSVVPAQPSDIKKGDFVGVGATGPDDGLQALEVLIFPASMRGTGEGHYAWSVPTAVANADRQAANAAPGTPAVQGTMTNGTVVGSGSPEATRSVQGTMTNGTVVGSGSSEAAPSVQSTMTNGTVATGSSKAGGRKLTLSYNNGKQAEISVPSGAPVVRLTSGQRSELTPGGQDLCLGERREWQRIDREVDPGWQKRPNPTDVKGT
jgi:hypothetical protein